MTTPAPRKHDLAYLRLLIGQMVRDGQVLHDAITEDGQETPAFGEGVNQYCLFWDGATLEERLDDIGPWGER